MRDSNPRGEAPNGFQVFYVVWTLEEVVGRYYTKMMAKVLMKSRFSPSFFCVVGENPHSMRGSSVIGNYMI
jgi:hypothetical protein